MGLEINANGSGGPRVELPRLTAELNPQTGQMNFSWPIDPNTGRPNEMLCFLLLARLRMMLEDKIREGADSRPPMITPASGLPMFRPGQHP